MANGDHVQAATPGQVVGGTSATATFASTPTVGNTVVVRSTTRKDALPGLQFAGYTKVAEVDGGAGTASTWYRHVQSGDGTGVTGTLDVSHTILIFADEYEGQLTFLDDGSAQSGSTIVSSQSTGTATATGSTDRLALGLISTRESAGSPAITGRTFTNSFTERLYHVTGDGNPDVHMTTADHRGTGDAETTMSWLGHSHRSWGAVATFDVPAGGGPEPKAASDSATLTEQTALDTGEATSKTGTDTGTLTETLTVLTAHAAGDSATATEAAGQIDVTDDAAEGTLTEQANLTVTVTAADSGTLTEQTQLNTGANPTATDTGTLTEQVALTGALTAADAATTGETTALTAALPASDTAALTEHASVDEAAGPQATDTATLTEQAVITVTVAGADTADLTDHAGTTATLVTVDTAALVELAAAFDLSAVRDITLQLGDVAVHALLLGRVSTNPLRLGTLRSDP